MPVTIRGVQKRSPAARAGLRAGDELISMNGREIVDVLDYRYALLEEKLCLVFRRDGKEKTVKLRKKEYDELGLEFDTYLMDGQRSCKNKCIFCFIDQMPPGLRESLYFKDDDDRLSFLFGNYITMTNLTEREVERIIELHLSPINISVHTTNPELRVRMMKNKHAGEVLSYLPRFAEAGLKINCQLVLCPGFNDGEELSQTLRDLGQLYPAVQSVAAVPVGLTKYREGLEELSPFDAATAADVVDRMERFGDAFLKEHGTRLCYPADEFYLKAGRPLPDSAFYEEFAQLENGVGMWSLLRDDYLALLQETEPDDRVRHVSLATGEAAAPLMQDLVDETCKKWHNLNCTVYPIRNDFFGPLITVAGLVTGGDLLAQLKDKPLQEKLLIPSCMLRREGDLFLDDRSLDELEAALGVEIMPVDGDAQSLMNALVGQDSPC